jgi:hypothetical protein
MRKLMSVSLLLVSALAATLASAQDNDAKVMVKAMSGNAGGPVNGVGVR